MTDKNKHIDQLIQDKLLGYQEQPPAHIWKALQPNTTVLWIKRGVAALFMLAITVAAYFWFTQKDGDAKLLSSQNVIKNTSSITNTDITSQDAHTKKTPIKSASTTEKVAAHKRQSTHSNTAKPFAKTNTSLANDIATQANQKLESKGLDEKTYRPHRNTNTKNHNRQIITALRCIVLKYLPYVYPMELPQPNKLLCALQAGKDFKDTDKPQKIKTFDNKWALGLELSPEWTKLQESHTTMQSYGIDFSARKYFNRFYLASGIGFSYSTDNGKYKVDYKKSEYKGSYQYVDSVDFEVDNNNNVIPIFYTTTREVYDTIDKVRISENKNKYFYINIPLYIGYEYALGKRWHANLYTGLRSGILVYKHIPDPDLEDNVFLVKSIYNDRKDFYLQGQVGIGIDYLLHKRWHLGLSPNMSYYFISPISNEDKKPYALGLRFGITYKWNK